MIIDLGKLNPLKWGHKTLVVPSSGKPVMLDTPLTPEQIAKAAAPRVTKPIFSHPLMQPGATMSTAPVVKQPNAFERFIDKLDTFFKKVAPIALTGAELARPFLALSPVGPEYNIALTGVETAISADQAIQASAGVPLTGAQKMAVAISVAAPQLQTILASKGITESTVVQTAIAQFAQNVYNLQTGPAAAVAPPAA